LNPSLAFLFASFCPYQIPETTTLFIICFSQLLITAVVFNLGSEYRQAMMSNPYLMAAMTILTTIYLLILFLPHDNAFMGGFMQLAYDQVAYRLRFWMLGLNAVNAALSIGCHVAIKAMFRCRGGGSLFPPLPH
jgi:magnesium-transporting ATPase (P-type)